MAMNTHQMAQAAGKAAGSDADADAAKAKAKKESPSQRAQRNLDRYMDMIKRSLGDKLNPLEFANAVVNAVATDPNLLKAMDESPASFIGAVLQAAILGLVPNTPLGHAYLVAYYAKDKIASDKAGHAVYKWQVNFQMGYRGVLELVHRSGELAYVTAETVFAKDYFDYMQGTERWLKHKPFDGIDAGRPIKFYALFKLKNGEDHFKVWSYEKVLDHAIKFSKSYNQDQQKFFGPWGNNFEAMAKKGLSLDTQIPTADGWITMGEIEKGMTVFDMNGNPTKVIAVSEEKNIDCYEITFANGEKIVCDDEHRWVAAIGKNCCRDVETHGWKTYTINELLKIKSCGKRIIVPVPDDVEFGERNDLNIHPWMLGYWLGNGHSYGASVSCDKKDVEYVKSRISDCGYMVGACRYDKRNNGVAIGIKSGLKEALREESLIANKHIPIEYLRGGRNQRLALLQGLMDSDGTIEKSRGRAIFTTTSDCLARQVFELVSSLGELVSMASRYQEGFGKRVKCYYLTWTPRTMPVGMPRKMERVRDRKVLCHRGVKKIRKIDSVTTKCIAVDSPTKTYLVSKSFIPTHNTVLLDVLNYAPRSTTLAAQLASDNTTKTVPANGADRVNMLMMPNEDYEPSAPQVVAESVPQLEVAGDPAATAENVREMFGLKRGSDIAKAANSEAAQVQAELV